LFNCSIVQKKVLFKGTFFINSPLEKGAENNPLRQGGREELRVWNLEFGTWNLEFGTWNLEFGI